MNQASQEMRSPGSSPSSKGVSPPKNTVALFLKGLKLNGLKIVGIGTSLLLVVGGGLLFANQSGWTPTIVWATLFPDKAPKSFYVENAQLTQPEARKLYAQSLSYLSKDKNYVEALKGFETLQKNYSGLLDFIYLHKAEAYTGLSDEKHCQEALKLLALHRPNSPLAPYAHYLLGQSFYRSGQKSQALKIFDQIVSNFPNSDYALGSFYYLGRLALEDPSESGKTKAVGYWKKYLEKTPSGRFGAEIAEGLETLIPSPSVSDKTLLGLAFAEDDGSAAKAMEYLKEAPFQDSWLALGKLQLKSNNPGAASQTFQKGLLLGNQPKEAQQVVDLLFKNQPGGFKAIHPFADKIKNLPPVPSGDYLLWRMAQVEPDQAASYFTSILNHYGTGDYAPESSWNLIWPSLKNHQTATFIHQSETHLKRFPHSRSAAKILFWLGKISEKSSQTSRAITVYKFLLTHHPTTYYAFRANGRLKQLEHHQNDPTWWVSNNTPTYPPDIEQAGFTVLDEKQMETLPEEIAHQAKELEMIGVPQDLTLLFKEGVGEVPASVSSWLQTYNGDRALGIRTIRDAIDTNFRKGILASKDQLKQLFPLPFSKAIDREASRNRLNPYLVQSLMREESYFNEFAVSGSNARGLMQLMPATAQEVAKNLRSNGFQLIDLFNPETNIQLGSSYLGYLHKIFNGNSMLAVGSYNGGPNAMKRWISSSSLFQDDPDFFVENIPYEQTRDYIKKVYTSYWNYTQLYSPKNSH
ncbi:MAG: transglycosylase SLT domain-containing protein [Cyanobacteria bacterium]|nr:transglycosylase SLT domain-containing protein [Cyanobacteriota bacterium]